MDHLLPVQLVELQSIATDLAENVIAPLAAEVDAECRWPAHSMRALAGSRPARPAGSGGSGRAGSGLLGLRAHRSHCPCLSVLCLVLWHALRGHCGDRRQGHRPSARALPEGNCRGPACHHPGAVRAGHRCAFLSAGDPPGCRRRGFHRRGHQAVRHQWRACRFLRGIHRGGRRRSRGFQLPDRRQGRGVCTGWMPGPVSECAATRRDRCSSIGYGCRRATCWASRATRSGMSSRWWHRSFSWPWPAPTWVSPRRRWTRRVCICVRAATAIPARPCATWKPAGAVRRTLDRPGQEPRAGARSGTARRWRASRGAVVHPGVQGGRGGNRSAAGQRGDDAVQVARPIGKTAVLPGCCGMPAPAT